MRHPNAVISRVLVFYAVLAAAGATSAQSDFRFKHPGLLHSRISLDVMRQNVESGKEPSVAAFEKFRIDPNASFNYRMRGPFETVSRNPAHKAFEADGDFKAAYYNAVMWTITGDRRHAEKSREILDAYSEHFKGYRDDDKDKQLTASLGPFLLINAAEIIRYTDSGWPEENAVRFEKLLKERIRPVLWDFAVFANGNWDTACIKTLLAIGVYCNDEETYKHAENYYRNGKGNGSLTHYVVNASGQCQESGRDQQHAQLGLGHLAEAAEIAFHQGGSLYEADDNRLLAGFEYTAKYCLGDDVPFVQHIDTTGKYKHKSISDKGRALRPIYEMVWNHYGRRKHLTSPHVEKAVKKLRPEGRMGNADHPGYGTLLFYVP